jgi:hypothetical protein
VQVLDLVEEAGRVLGVAAHLVALQHVDESLWMCGFFFGYCISRCSRAAGFCSIGSGDSASGA